jgi:hypothetical protein
MLVVNHNQQIFLLQIEFECIFGTDYKVWTSNMHWRHWICMYNFGKKISRSEVIWAGGKIVIKQNECLYCGFWNGSGIVVWPLCSNQHNLTGTFPKSKPNILQKYLVQEYKMSIYWYWYICQLQLGKHPVALVCTHIHSEVT